MLKMTHICLIELNTQQSSSTQRNKFPSVNTITLLNHNLSANTKGTINVYDKFVSKTCTVKISYHGEYKTENKRKN